MHPDGGNTSIDIGVQISTVIPFTGGNCGQFLWAIKWKLKNAAGDDGGFIVQWVRKRLQIWDCDGRVIADDSQELWEAWPIAAGTDSTGSEYDDAYLQVFLDDESDEDGFTCSRGIVSIVGWYRFIRGPIPPIFKPGSVPVTKGPATTKDPGIDFSRRSGARQHSLWVSWDCCDDEN